MKCSPEKFKIRELVDAWNNGSLKINSEYQRGATWKKPQMQGLIDSVFRAYPLPPVFLHKIESVGLGGKSVERFEIVDGQQRIRSFSEFFDDKLPLLKPEDKNLRLPNSLRNIPAPWGGRLFSQLDQKQCDFLNQSEIDAFVLTEVDNPDEVRDLFIRLQSGTALNRQQVRDAWPGSLGPFIESLAGKLDREPSSPLFGLIDRRSDKGDDDIDRFTTNRQVCAQLLALLLARRRDPFAAQSITADDLDRLYHSNTEFDPKGAAASAFIAALGETSTVLVQAIILSGGNGRAKMKFKKLDVFSAFFLIQDLKTNPQFKLDNSSRKKIAEQIATPPAIAKQGKAVSGRAILEYYEQWKKGLPDKLGIRLDPKRLFDEEQKAMISSHQDGMCAICGGAVEPGDAEFDHFPIPYYLGGKTEVANGRLVCSKCHPRGRPGAEGELILA